MIGALDIVNIEAADTSWRRKDRLFGAAWPPLRLDTDSEKID